MAGADPHHDHQPRPAHGQGAGDHAASPERRAQQRERFSVQEIGQVLSHYDIGVIKEIREYKRGSRRAAKLKLVAERGTFLLKRRALGRSIEADRSRASASHKLQQIAFRGGVPVASLTTLRSGGTLLQLIGRLYELYSWVPGERYNHHQEQARAAGIALARMHGAFANVELIEELPLGGFSESDSVRAVLDRAQVRALERAPTETHEGISARVRSLAEHLERIDAKLTLKGLPLQRNAICHGDFHPGNTLWYGESLGAVIDFDSTRREAVAAEIANAALHFSVRQRVGVDPLLWPIGLDPENLRAFIAGYAAASSVDLRTVASLIPWLMMSSIIAEAATPIARDGDFAGIPAQPFLEATERLVDWIAQRTRAITAVIEQETQ